MPSFKDSNNPALNPELAIKKEVMRRTKDANRGTEGAEIPVVSQQVSTPYGDLYKLLVSINALFNETVLELVNLRGTNSSTLSDRFKSSSSAISQQLKFANQYLKKMKYDLSGFSDDELKGIEKEYNVLKENEAIFDEYMEEYKTAEDRYAGVPGQTAQSVSKIKGDLKRRYDALVVQFRLWIEEYNILSKRLGDALKRTNRVADVAVGAGYSGGLLPSHYAITTAGLPRRFI
jgi:uncharacterized protein YukE